jgi:ubiquinone/menaquinone biosynthesis C-methylase UbiE
MASCSEVMETVYYEEVMTTKYDQETSQRYQEAKEQPWRIRAELFSLMDLVGDVRGKKVIDLACGDGWLTRALRKAGASPVLGFDLSAEMIALARKKEAEEPLGVEYDVEDAREDGPSRDADLVTSNWLLVYARDRDVLSRMCRTIARQVRPRGRFVTLITNPDLYTWQADPPDYRKYGFTARLPDAPVEGAPVVFSLFQGDAVLEVENYFLSRDAYASALRSAGFRDVAFHDLKLGPDPSAGDEGDYWDDFFRQPLAVLIDGVKE